MSKITLSKLGLGAGPLGGNYDSFDSDTPVDTIKTAFENGINWLDTSPYYGNSESVVGQALEKIYKDHPRESFYISTKIGRYGYFKKDFDYSAKRTRMSVMSSLEKLKTSYLDFVYCHDVEFVDLDQVTDCALPELFKMKQEGIIKNVGISYPLDILLKIAEIQHKKGQPLDQVLSYCHANLHNQQAIPIIPKFRSYGVKYVFMASPLSMGLLRSQGPPEWHPASSELKSAVTSCIECMSANNCDPVEVAMTYAFDISFSSHDDYNNADGYVVGMLGKDQVLSSLGALTNTLKLSNGDGNNQFNPKIAACLEQVKKIMAPFQDYTWESPPADA
ncbi:L-galactose dehydrogenase [Smittium culicis]|uniref:L-galactose dehydrogenase n=1 Tax=Smittium culicis TaxID=133412 RepID=A0A1R1Y5H8_9FUNG|nr:L-galactose dehydrogenase [Smittium culicis]